MTLFPQICEIVEFSASFHITKNSPQHIPPPSTEVSRANRFRGLCRTWEKRHWLLRKRQRRRDRKRVGNRQRSLSFLSFLPRRERPLLAGKSFHSCGDTILQRMRGSVILSTIKIAQSFKILAETNRIFAKLFFFNFIIVYWNFYWNFWYDFAIELQLSKMVDKILEQMETFLFFLCI